MGDPNPAVLDQKFRFALNFAIDREAIVDKAYQGAGDPGDDDHPAGVLDVAAGARRSRCLRLRPRQGEGLLDEAGYTVGDDGFRTMPDGSPIGQLRLYARSDSHVVAQTRWTCSTSGSRISTSTRR